MAARSLLVLCVLALVTPAVAAAADAAKLFGFAGIDADDFATIENAGVISNAGVLDFQAIAQTSVWNAQPVKKRPFISLDTLLFIPDSTIESLCQPTTWRLRTDWRQRTSHWLRVNQQYLKPDLIAGLVLVEEANNDCVDPASLDEVTQFLRTKLGTSLPLGFGEGTGTGTKPLLILLPAQVDFVALFNYDALDPEDLRFQTSLDEIKWELQPQQTYLLVAKAFLFIGEQIRASRLGREMAAYAQYCKSEPLCSGLLGFLYRTVPNNLVGTDQMPEAWLGDAAASRILLSPN